MYQRQHTRNSIKATAHQSNNWRKQNKIPI